MAIEVASVATTRHSANAGVSAPGNLPSGVQEFDLLLAHIVLDPCPNITSNSGYTPLVVSRDITTQPGMAVFGKFATAGEGAPQFTLAADAFSSTTVIRITGHTLQGAISAEPNRTSSFVSNAGAVTAASINVQEPGELLLLYGGAFPNNQTGNFAAITGMTNVYDRQSGGFQASKCWRETRQSVGATGTRTVDFSVNNIDQHAIMILVRPESLTVGDTTSMGMLG